MAKKLLYTRAMAASCASVWPATFEDISDDEIDYSEHVSAANDAPIDMTFYQPIDYSAKSRQVVPSSSPVLPPQSHNTIYEATPDIVQPSPKKIKLESQNIVQQPSAKKIRLESQDIVQPSPMKIGLQSQEFVLPSPKKIKLESLDRFENFNESIVKSEPEDEDEEEGKLVIDTNKNVQNDLDEDEKLLVEWNEKIEKLENDLDNLDDKPSTPVVNESIQKFVLEKQVEEKLQLSTPVKRKRSSPKSKCKPKSPPAPAPPPATPTAQYNCQYCTRKYWKQNKLRDHVKTHHTGKPSHQENVAKNNDGEEGKKFLISRCPDCKMQLQTKTDMYVHRLTHIIPTFSSMNCPICKKSQCTFPALKDHMKKEHGIAEKWFCPICPDGRTFTQNHSLLIHISTFHFNSNRNAPHQYTCDKCKRAFASKALLGKHMNNEHFNLQCKQKPYKMFKCEMCDKYFQDMSHLKDHLMSEHAPDFSKKSPEKKKEEFTAKFLSFKKKFTAKSSPFTISSILSEA